MSAHYRYDGTFTGLLSLVAQLLSENEPPVSISSEDAQQTDLFARRIEVAADPAAAARLRTALCERSPEADRVAACAYLSVSPVKELAIFVYLARVLSPRRSLPPTAGLPRAEALATDVRREAYRFKGLVRFRELSDGLLYAPIAPENRVLPFLGRHFAARLKDEHWLIHDVERGAAIAGCRGRCREGTLELPPSELSAQEDACQRLWRRFFEEIAIEERLSAERQRNRLPLKVRRHLIELS